MKIFQSIKFWIFDLDNTLYSGKTRVFEQVDKKDEEFFSKSYAAFIILRELKSPLRYLFYLVPTFFADFIYNLIAKRRYSWFGKKEECIFPIDNPKFLID